MSDEGSCHGHAKPTPIPSRDLAPVPLQLVRSIGVALADGTVHPYFERGTRFPASRSCTHTLVHAVQHGDPTSTVRIPVLQGESVRARSCRLVCVLEVAGIELQQTAKAGDEVSVTLAIDDHGLLCTRARLAASGQESATAADLLAGPQLDTLRTSLAATRAWLTRLNALAFRSGSSADVASLRHATLLLVQAEAHLGEARAHDDDAARKVHRGLVALDALLDRLETASQVPDLMREAQSAVAWAATWLTLFGSAEERTLFDDVAARLDDARRLGEAVELRRRLRQVRQLGHAAYQRHPSSTKLDFERAAAGLSATSDPNTQTRIAEGRKALATGDSEAVRRITRALQNSLRPASRSYHDAHRSGLQ